MTILKIWNLFFKDMTTFKDMKFFYLQIWRYASPPPGALETSIKLTGRGAIYRYWDIDEKIQANQLNNFAKFLAIYIPRYDK